MKKKILFLGLLFFLGTSHLSFAQQSADISYRAKKIPLPVGNLTTHQSEYSPAVLVKSSSSQITLFTDLYISGLEGPTHLAFSTAKGVKTCKLPASISNPGLSSSWILVWFNGGKGWDRIHVKEEGYHAEDYEEPVLVSSFDLPYLIVLQHKPEKIAKDKKGLQLSFSKEAGYISILPLYGGLRVPVDKTGNWKEGLPEKVVERCSFWEKVLKAFPTCCREDFRLDREKDEIIIRQTFDFIRINDDWATPVETFSPVSPSVALAHQYKFPLDFSKKVIDLDYITPKGPFMAVKGNSYTYTIRGMLKYVNYVEEAKNPKGLADASLERLTREIAYLVKINVEDYFSFRNSEKDWSAYEYSLGAKAVDHYILARSIQYLSPDLKEKTKEACIDMLRRGYLNPRNFVSEGEDAKTGRKFLRGSCNIAGGGDIPGADDYAWTGFILAGMWSLAYYTDSWDLLEQHWEDIVKPVFNHMTRQNYWSAPVMGQLPWDTGAPLQGVVAFTRMAAALGDEASYNLGAYLSGKYLLHQFTMHRSSQWLTEKVGQWHQPLFATEKLIKSYQSVYSYTGPGIQHPYRFKGYHYPWPYTYHYVSFGSVMRFWHDHLYDIIEHEWDTLLKEKLPGWTDSKVLAKKIELEGIVGRRGALILFLRSSVLRKSPARIWEEYKKLRFPGAEPLGFAGMAQGRVGCLLEIITSTGERSYKPVYIPFVEKPSFQRGIDLYTTHKYLFKPGAHYDMLSYFISGEEYSTFPVLSWHPNYIPPLPWPHTYVTGLALGEVSPDLKGKPFNKKITESHWGMKTYSASFGPVKEPVSLNYDKEKKMLYILGAKSPRLCVFNPEERKIISSISIGKSPTDMVIDYRLNKLYIGCKGSGEVYVLNRSDYKLLKTIPVAQSGEPGPKEGWFRLSFLPALKEIYLVDGKTNRLYVIDEEKDLIRDMVVLEGVLDDVAVNTATGKIYVMALSGRKGSDIMQPNGYIFIVDGHSHKVVKSLKAYSNTLGSITVDSKRNLIYFTVNRYDHTAIIDGEKDEVIAGVGVGNNLRWGFAHDSISVDEKTGLFCVASLGPSTISLIDPFLIKEKHKNWFRDLYKEMEKGEKGDVSSRLAWLHHPISGGRQMGQEACLKCLTLPRDSRIGASELVNGFLYVASAAFNTIYVIDLEDEKKWE